MTQTDAVGAFLRQHLWITPLAALHQLGCFRLAARIKELRQAGWDIRTDYETTAAGKRHAVYTLMAAPDATR